MTLLLLLVLSCARPFLSCCLQSRGNVEIKRTVDKPGQASLFGLHA